MPAAMHGAYEAPVAWAGGWANHERVGGLRWVGRAASACLAAAIAVGAAAVPAASAPGAPSVILRQQVIATGLTSPWGLAFLPDGSALVSERDTQLIKRVTPKGRVTTVGRVPGAVPEGEGGLLGIAVPPEPSPRYVYAYYTAAEGNRVSRFAWDGRQLGSEQLLLRGIPKAAIHNGGRIAFGPDGMLYIATGDAADPELSQDRRSLAGKVLRMAPDGSVPKDNPFPGSLVWTLGHRNVQGLAFGASGRVYASEFGQRDVDEVNLLRPGANYGWPVHEGAADDRRFVNPIASWSPTAIASPSGMAVIDGSAYVASLRGQRLWRIPLRGDGAGRPRAVALGDLGRLRTIAQAPDGSMWLVTSNTDGRGQPRASDDRIIRLRVR